MQQIDESYLSIKKDANLVAEINALRQNSCILLGEAKKRNTMLDVGIAVDKFMPDAEEVIEKI